MIILDGKKISEKQINNLKEKLIGLKISLAVIQIGNNEASNVYITQKKKMCENLGIEFKLIKLVEETAEKDILDIIENLNSDDTTGILIQLPIPRHLNIIKIQNSINYKKDIDGLNYINVNKLINKEKGLIPCTAKGIMTLLKHYNISIASKKVVIIGRSNLVGKPISNLFLNEDATVTICHSKTINLSSETQKADILIVATGVSNLITADMVKKDSVIIDVGINKIENKLIGDVDVSNVKEKASYITPVPGGIGPMTICSLAENLYEAYLFQNNK